MSTISFLIAKAHANHSKSPSEQMVGNMINAEKITDVESILQGTAYGPLMEEIRPSVNLAGFEIGLRRQYAKLLHLYQNAATGKVEKLLDTYSLLLEAENLDLILQAILRNNVSDDLENIIIPVGKYGMRHYRRIMENTDVKVATDFIIHPPLKKAAQAALAKSDDKDEQIFQLSAALSHASYSALNEVAPDWIRLEIEFLNLETICRAINLDLDPEPWMIPDVGLIYRQRSVLSNMSTPRDILTYIEPNFPASRPLRAALESDRGVVNALEDEALRYLYYRRYRNFMLFGNRKETVLDFFAIKKAEIEDISRILLSKIKSVPATEVRRMLYPIYRRK